MNIREDREELEEKILSNSAQLSQDSRGRLYEEEKCKVRTDYQRDRDRIIHSKSFRRLKHKTQVFIAPEGDHYRTRLTHTLEVTQIARTISRALRLNEDLAEAIALGHDLGHTPFGHSGEKVLNELNPKGFRHNHQSLRVVDFLEEKNKKFPGLNLTFEVRDGILNHSGDGKVLTLEAQVVKISDRIAYINHDIDDALRSGILSKKDFTYNRDFLKLSASERVESMISDIINTSYNKSYIKMSKEGQINMEKLRKELFNNLYLNSQVKGDEDKVYHIMSQIYKYYYKHIDRLPERYAYLKKKYDISKDTIITDYISGMTDRYILNLYKNLFIPKTWHKI